MNILAKALLCGVLAASASCAGPTTPFGASFWGPPTAQTQVEVSPEFSVRSPAAGKARVSSYPRGQIYHSPFDLVLRIEDNKKIPEDFRYEILYNGRRVSRWLKGEKILIDPANPKVVRIVFENLSLLPGRQNEIVFLYYRNKDSSPVAYAFSPPQCGLRENKAIATLGPFKAPGLRVSKIEKAAAANEVNPALLAALVAQESGFNPLAISWAKAVGLTQVTSLANKEILALRPRWQYDPKVEGMSFLELKTHILSRKINSDNDWRLDKQKSLEGGALYLNLLTRYWDGPGAVSALAPFGEKVPMTDIILASYNSGAYRVKKALISKKADWLKSGSLKEARKYVMNIKSYCHAFSHNDMPRTETSRTETKEKI